MASGLPCGRRVWYNMCWGIILRCLRTGLGSTSVVLNGDGMVHSEARYYPYGVTRWSSGTLPTDYRFTGQREDGYIKLTVMSARWYDAQLGRWISPDPIVPDPANPQSFNRLSYVRNNPLKFIDPSGFCEGTAGDHPASEDACWNWIAQIHATYSNIWVDSALWTAEELALVYGAFGMHIFKEEILSAALINLRRREGGDLGPAGQWTYRNGAHEVTIFDRAYFFTPDANQVEVEASTLNFQGTVIHEFTHVATWEDPQILASYRDSQPFFTLTQPVGGEYGWARCGTDRRCKYSERVAVTTSAYSLTPDVFKWEFLFLEGEYWQLDWIRQFNRPPGLGEITISAP
jgi:RHS repeat-associated protein